MDTRVIQQPLIIRDENAKQATVDAKTSKKAAKKGGTGFGGRKALKDITNKSSVQPQISSGKTGLLKKESDISKGQNKNIEKDFPEKEFNIAEEGFLHDHNKCIKEQQAAFDYFDLNLVLPGHDSASAEDKLKEAKAEEVDFDSICWCSGPVELPEPDLSDFLRSSSRSTSPPNRDAAADFDSFWEFQEVEFVLKQGIDD